MAEAGKSALPALNWRILLQQKDVALAVMVVLIIAMLILPMPAFLLDLFLTLNIALGITILLVSLYTKEPLQYSTFPTILLISTLFRLGLNVSSTRLILLSGEAGSVIQAFGSFVIGGNYVVGLLIFIILMIINFMVITNGAGRVSEVSARFTLDALPGKQLSIDAELNAGHITEQEAREKRKNTQKEADFYGTMDGASKFVKGDAIAGIIITLINIIGGLIIGILQLNMDIATAASTFTILTVGDGLVSQLPALVISTATGILVTRVSENDSSLGDDITTQMFMNPKILGILGALLIMLGLIPGMPNVPFLVIGLAAGGLSYVHYTAQTKAVEEEKANEVKEAAAKKKKANSSENILDLLPLEALELEMGYRLVPLIEPENGGDLLERIAQIRRQVATELGFVLPSVRVRDNLQLEPNQYIFKLRGVPVGQGSIMPDMWLAMGGDTLEEGVHGIQTTEPAFGLPAWWVEEDDREDVEISGFTVVSPSAVVSTHLTELIRQQAPEILSRQDVQELLDNIQKTHPTLLDGFIPDTLNIAELHLILQNLLRERVSIRDMVSILEALGYHARVSKEVEYLTEQCRMALSRSICKQHLSPATNQLPSLTLAPDLEEAFAQGLFPASELGSNQGGHLLALSPEMTQHFLEQLGSEVERILTTQGLQPVLLCNAKLRSPLRKLIERMLPQMPVISYNEVGPSVQVQALGVVRLAG